MTKWMDEGRLGNGAGGREGGRKGGREGGREGKKANTYLRSSERERLREARACLHSRKAWRTSVLLVSCWRGGGREGGREGGMKD